MSQRIKNPHLLARSGSFYRMQRRREPRLNWTAIWTWTAYGSLVIAALAIWIG